MYNSNQYSDKFQVRLQLNREQAGINLFNYELADTFTLNYDRPFPGPVSNLQTFYESKKDEFLNVGIDRFYSELAAWFQANIPGAGIEFIVFSSSGNCIRFDCTGTFKVRQSVLHAEQRSELLAFVNTSEAIGLMPPVTFAKITKAIFCPETTRSYLTVKAVGDLKAVVIVTGIPGTEANRLEERILPTLQQVTEHYFLQKDLVHARFIAASAHRTPVGLLSCISHELRTPLNSIIGFAGLLAKEDISAVQRDYTTCIQTSGHKLLAVVTDLIDMADIEQGRLTSEHFDINIPELLSRRKEHFEQAAASNGLALSVNVEASVPEIVIGDGRVLDKVIFHLIDSAIVHSTNGDVQVNMKTIDQHSGTGMLELEVAAPYFGGLLNSIFRETPGYEELNENNTHGLTIVNAFVQLASGDMKLSMLENGYACYKVLLPYELKENTRSISPVPDEGALADKRCLVVEDNLQNAKLITKLLSDRKIISDHALNGRIALELIEERDYDFILMDLQMPEMDGFETIRHIRERSDHKVGLPVMVITANATPGIRLECRTAGFSTFLNKPFSADDLFKSVISMLIIENYPAKNDNVQTNSFENDAQSDGVNVCIDLTYLKSFSAGDEEFEKDMLTSSGEDIEEKMAALGDAFRSGDSRQVKELTHSLKSLFSIAGFEELNGSMCSIENDYRYNLLDDGARALYDKSSSTWDIAKKQLEQAIAQYS